MRTVPFGGPDTKYYIIIAFVVVIILLIVFRTQLQALITGKPASPTTTPPAPIPANTTSTVPNPSIGAPESAGTTSSTVPSTQNQSAGSQGAVITVPDVDTSINLSLGSTGPEVNQLQIWLGITPVTGTFDYNTQSTLYQATGLYSTTLAQFQSLIQGYAAAQNSGIINTIETDASNAYTAILNWL